MGVEDIVRAGSMRGRDMGMLYDEVVENENREKA